MIAHIDDDALVLRFHHPCHSAPVVSHTEQAVHDDDWVPGAVDLMNEFHFLFSVLKPIRLRSF